MPRTLLHTSVLVAVLVGALGLAQAATIKVSPFEELSLCLPFNVRVAHPSSSDAAYSVVVRGDQVPVKHCLNVLHMYFLMGTLHVRSISMISSRSS